MLRLDLKRENFDLELLPDLVVTVRPFGSAVMAAAQADPAVEEFRAAVEAGEARSAVVAVAIAKVVAREAIVAWSGVGDMDGNPLEVSPVAIDALLDDWHVYNAWQAQYVAPGLRVISEGNG